MGYLWKKRDLMENMMEFMILMEYNRIFMGISDINGK